MSALRPGEVFANRFNIDGVAGVGGMGTVYRSRDGLSGVQVALKVLHAAAADPQVGSRFAREAQILTNLRHPGIVKYVAHGIAEGGHAYLAMEWLEGEDLRQRLQRVGLNLSESLSLLRQVATALAEVHSRGVIHRDIKPSNLFLRSRDVGRATLIDFGIARRSTQSQAITRSGHVIGTPEYMAPEQARGEQALTPAADIFSLGCIFFECLTGAPPFASEHLAAVLAKILFEQPRRLRELRPDLPDSVDRLVHRMLAKEPLERPADAPGLLAELDALAGFDAPAPPLSFNRPSSAVLTGVDRELVCVLLAMAARPPGDAEDQPLDPLEVEAKHALHRQIRRAVERSGAQVERMVDASLVATFTAVRGTATDLVTEAARAALLVRELWPEACISLATGRGTLGGAIPTGEALDRAAQMLRGSAEPAAPTRILLDEITAGLLDARFRTRRTPSGTLELSSVELSADESRLLLGKPTSCVGREAELGALDGLLTACIEDSHARAVLVTAPPGLGKSRLRHEFLQRVAARGEPVLVLLGRADPLATHSAYGLFGQAVRRLCMVQDGEPLEVRRQKLLRRVAARVPAGEATSVAEFLGEICAIPFPDEESLRLRAARQDPQLMGERLQEAALAFLRSECAAQPVLLVLEDLHWSDIPTVRLVGLALMELRETPLLVLALARPELSEHCPDVWDYRVQRLPLQPLSKRASERLATQALGPAATPSVLARIVEQAAGNALYLEELIRAAAEGKGEEPPATVLAMLQARISRLDPEVRRVLRAASAFGETFWLGGLCALLGAEGRRDSIEFHLEALTSGEIVKPRRESRFAGERELHFRHALMRDAAYALLSEDELRACHRLCLSYLEQVGEVNLAVLSEHALRAGDAERTLRYVGRAAQHAFDRCDIEGVERLAELGLRCDAQGEARGALLSFLAWVYTTRQRFTDAFEAGDEAMQLLPVGSAGWYFAAMQLLGASRITGHQDAASRTLARLAGVRPAPDAVVHHMGVVCILTSLYVNLGLREPIERAIRGAEQILDQAPSDHPVARGFLLYGKALLAFRLEAAPFAALADARAANTLITECGHRHYRFLCRGYLALTLMQVGRHDEGADLLHEVVAEAQRLREPVFAIMAKLHLIACLSDKGSREAAEEAVSLARSVMSSGSAPAALLHAAQPSIAQSLWQLGEREEAERMARDAIVALKPAPLFRVAGYTVLTRILLGQGRAAEARASAEEGLSLVQSLGGSGHTEVALRLVLAEARRAAGDAAAADEALREAIAELRLRADDAPDPASRSRYLSAVPANARLVELGQQWLSERVD